MISKYWSEFCKIFLADNSYWYIPKGLSVKEENFNLIKKRLKVLEEFEGQKWFRAQNKFVNKLLHNNLFKRRVNHLNKPDNAAIGRMFKIVVSSLGFAWVNESEKIFITKIGKKLLKSKENEIVKIFNNQISRFQFYNPSFPKKDGFEEIKLNPIQYLSELLYRIEGNYITKEEYILFISKKKSILDVEISLREIEAYRKLNEKNRLTLIKFLNSKKIPSENLRRSTIFNTIELESSYALNFYASSGLFKYSDGKLLLIGSKRELKRKIEFFRKNFIWIEFRSHKDWFYYYGEDSFNSPIKFAMEYYLDISDIENSIKIYRIAKKAGFVIREFKSKEDEFKTVLVDEKILEDFLEKHIEELESDLRLVKNGRQFPTISGPIDLLAKDSKGNYVIVELKKGRIPDKVIGQIARYASFIGTNLTSMKKVRAIIVGKTIDNNLCLSINLLKISCNLYEFDYKVKFERIKP